MPSYVDGASDTISFADATLFSTTSITIADVNAANLEDLILSAQASNFALTTGDFGATALTAIDITGAATLDTMSFTDVILSLLNNCWKVDTFVVDGMDGLTSITAAHTNVTGAANPLGTKLHPINNTSLLEYTSATNKCMKSLS